MKQHVSDGSNFFDYKGQRNRSQPLGAQERSGNKSFHLWLEHIQKHSPSFCELHCNITATIAAVGRWLVVVQQQHQQARLEEQAPPYLAGMTNLETFSWVRFSSDELRCQISPTVKVSELSSLHASPDALGKIHHSGAEQIRLLSYNHGSWSSLWGGRYGFTQKLFCFWSTSCLIYLKYGVSMQCTADATTAQQEAYWDPIVRVKPLVYLSGLSHKRSWEFKLLCKWVKREITV